MGMGNTDPVIYAGSLHVDTFHDTQFFKSYLVVTTTDLIRRSKYLDAVKLTVADESQNFNFVQSANFIIRSKYSKDGFVFSLEVTASFHLFSRRCLPNTIFCQSFFFLSF